MPSALRAALLGTALICSCQPAPLAKLAPRPAVVAVDEAPPAARAEVELRSPRAPMRDAGRRPLLVATIPFDYASLPVEGPSQPTRGSARGSFTLRSIDEDGYRLHIADDLLAEIDVTSKRFYSMSRAWALKHRPRSVPAYTPSCGPYHGVPGTDITSASWEGIRVSTWTDEAIDYVRYQGPFDLVACHGTPTSATRTRATALIPKLIYAYRACSLGCLTEIDERPREEVLTIVAPPSWWLNATVTATEQKLPHVGSFSHVRVTVARGGSASALFTVAGHDLAYFVGLRDGALREKLGSEDLRDEVVQFTIEAVWLEGERAPTGTIYVAAPSTLNSDLLVRTVLPAELLEP